MIDWIATKERFGYNSIPDIKRPKVVCRCDNCNKQRNITVRIKSTVIDGQFNWLCPSCVNLRDHKRISFSMKKLWNDKQYKTYRSESSLLTWQNEEYKLKHSTATIDAMKHVNMTDILKKRYEDPVEREKHRQISLKLFSTQEFVDKHKKSMASQEVRDKCSIGARSAWKSPEYREKMVQILSKSSKNLWADPEYRERMSKTIGENSKKLWADPEHRERISKIFSESSKRKWTDSEYRERISKIISENSKKLWADPKYRERMSKIISDNSKKLWADPEYRERMITICDQPEYRERMSKTMIGLWANPEYRERMSHIMIRLWTDPEFKERMSKILSENSKCRWADPEFKERMSKTISENSKKLWTDPEYRERMIRSSKRLWANPEYREQMATTRAQQPRISSIQLQLYKYLDNLGVEYHKEGTETTIGHYVFDCMIPKQGSMRKHLLVECQGDYWHSLPKSIRNDKSKFTYIDHYFPEHEIMYVWEHEFYVKDRVLDRLKLKLGVGVETVDFNFKDIKIKEVLSRDVKLFLDAYHYIGKGRGGKCFGAYLKDELIACVVFSSPLRQNTAGQFGLVDSNIRELSRLCIHPSYHKKNFASWLISRTIKDVDCELIVAYADTTVGHTGAVYKASNFELHHNIKSDYWYIDGDGYVMHKKTLYSRACRMKMKESDFARKYGYHKRYGGEKLCFVRKTNAS